MRGGHSRRGRGFEQSLKQGARPPGDDALRENQFAIGGRCDLNGPREGVRIGRKYQTRREQINGVFHTRRVRRQQRIGWRDGRIGNAHMHGAQRQQRMLQVVARQDHDRAIRPEAARQQGLPDGTRAGVGVGIAEVSPLAIGTAFGKKGALRRGSGPARQHLGVSPRVGRQRLARTQQPAAVGALFGNAVIRAQLYGPKGCS